MLRVALIMGGQSRERAVSLKSGKAVEKALREEGFSVDSYDIEDGHLPQWTGGKPDVVFLALHGGSGENGEIQKELEELGLPYTGSGPEACRIAMDKLLAKREFEKAGLFTPLSCLVSSFWPLSIIQTLAKKHLQYPVVLKPCQEGSSIGVFIVRTPEELEISLKEAFAVSREILMEKYMAGREFTVALLEESPLPMIEIRSNREFFNYQAKYEDTETQYIFDPDIPETVKKSLEKTALLAHRALGCRHFSRVDLIWTGKEIHVLELNTIPGLTGKSLLPMAAKRAGFSFGDLCKKMTLLTLQKKRLSKTG